MSRLRFDNRKRVSLWICFFFVILFTIVDIFIFLRFQNTVKPSNIIMQNQSPLSIKRTSVHIPSKTHSIRCIVHLFHCIGRLGNRMFVVATAYALARLHSCHLHISTYISVEMKSVFAFDLQLQSFLLPERTFRLIMRNTSNSMTKITRDIGCQYFPELMHPNGISQGTIFEVKGFWQTYLHFANYSNEFRENIFVARQSVLETVSTFFIELYQQKFGFTPQFSLENHQSFKKQLAQSNKTTWIGMHIRRSDFVKSEFASSDKYLFNTIEYYTIRYPNAHFIVASDDKRYCKKLFRDRSNIFLTPQSFSPGDDLITLSLCQHSIITGGTFGWWSAYLANGEVVHDTVYRTTCEKNEYYYPSWFKNDTVIILPKNTL